MIVQSEIVFGSYLIYFVERIFSQKAKTSEEGRDKIW